MIPCTLFSDEKLYLDMLFFIKGTHKNRTMESKTFSRLKIRDEKLFPPSIQMHE